MLPAPNLDDRSFQDLVDDAKRFVQQRCPEWTDHNVSDPGVTLIETFAWMTDVLLFRLNRVPDRIYTKFLDLLGVRLHPPAPAKVDVEFRLSAPQDEVIVVPARTEVATRRTTAETSISFEVSEELEILPASLQTVGSAVDGSFSTITDRLGTEQAVECFSSTPQPEDALYLGFDRATPRHTLLLTVVCELGGHGIDPDNPPVAWEAWCGDWVPCAVPTDTTGGLNRTGVVELLVPDGHVEAPIEGHGGAWIRCRVVEEDLDQGIYGYRDSPRITEVSGATIGATAEVVHARLISDETIGVSDGVAGQEFQVEHTPVLPGEEPVVLEVRRPEIVAARSRTGEEPEHTDEWVTEDWELRPDFADSTERDRHFTLDPTEGTIRFGPLVRMADGTVRQHGAVPAKGSVVRVRRYRAGGGARGNVAPGAISVLRTSIPMVASVRNHRAARGGVDGETVTEAKSRGPIQLRTRNRAVTKEDFEALAKEAAPEIARVRCVLDEDPDSANLGAVKVLIVPSVHGDEGKVDLFDLDPDEETGERVAAYLDERRLIGTRLLVEPPSYLGIHIDARVVAREKADPAKVKRRAVEELHTYFHPVLGGPDGDGWPFGRAVRATEIYGVLQNQSGIDVVEDVVVNISHPATGAKVAEQDVIELGPTNLVLVTAVELDVQT